MIGRVRHLTAQKLDWLLGKVPENVCKATLAQLRRGVGHAPGEIPSLWSILLRDIPEDMQGKGLEASRTEIAIYSALTLFAVHQQGRDPRKDPMHKSGQPFGAAIARLITPGDDNARERIERRFTRAVTAADMIEFAQHLRSLVQLLRNNGIPLDWADLAAQMWLYQNPEFVAGVRLRWGEDFYTTLNHYETNHQEEVQQV